MALINEDDFKAQEDERDVAGAFAGMRAKLPGLNAVRRPSALVVELLRRSNNFFATGQAGLESIGIKDANTLASEINGKRNPKYDPMTIVKTIPQIAEVAALLTCSDDDLDECDEDPKHSRALARKIMRELTTGEIIELLPAIQDEFEKVNRSAAIVPESASDEPKSIVEDPKKKQRHTG
jgi:hypothetical protein